MSLTATTIAQAIDAYTNLIMVTSATGCVAGQPARIDNELVKIQGVNDVQLTVMRGINGTQGVAHNALADFVTGPFADFPVEQFPLAGSYTYSVDGALSVAPGVHKLIKAATSAMTLATPTRAQEGMQLTIIALSTKTHVVTLNLAGSPTTLNFNAIGDSAVIIAAEGVWFILSLNSVTAS